MGIARAIVNDPLVVPPTSPPATWTMRRSARSSRVLKKVSASGTAVLVATHDVSVAREFRALTLMLEAGRLVAGRAAGRRPLRPRRVPPGERARRPRRSGREHAALHAEGRRAQPPAAPCSCQLTSVAVMGLSPVRARDLPLITVNLRAAIAAVQKQVEVVVFVKEDIRDEELKSLDAFLRELPGRRRRALPHARRRAGQVPGELKEREYLLEALETNPLPDTRSRSRSSTTGSRPSASPRSRIRSRAWPEGRGQVRQGGGDA